MACAKKLKLDGGQIAKVVAGVVDGLVCRAVEDGEEGVKKVVGGFEESNVVFIRGIVDVVVWGAVEDGADCMEEFVEEDVFGRIVAEPASGRREESIVGEDVERWADEVVKEIWGEDLESDGEERLFEDHEEFEELVAHIDFENI